MQKRSWIILGVILILILALIIILFSVFSLRDGCKNLPSNSSSLSPSYSERDKCYISEALNRSKLEYCYKIIYDSNLSSEDSRKSWSARVECFSKMAILEDDLTICDLLYAGIEFQSPRANCYRKFAVYKKDLGLCNDKKIKYSSFDYAECISDIALAMQNLSICAILSPGLTQERCYLDMAKSILDYKICSYLDDGDWCYYDLAKLTKNESICEFISSKPLITSCKTSFVHA